MKKSFISKKLCALSLAVLMGAGVGTISECRAYPATDDNEKDTEGGTADAESTDTVKADITTAAAAFLNEKNADSPSDLRKAPGSVTDNSVVLVWEKPVNRSSVTGYNIYCNGKKIAQTSTTYYKVENLSADTSYKYVIKAKNAKGKESEASNSIEVNTESAKTILNVKDFGAVGDGVTKDTEAIQKAIDECKEGETVLLPAGKYLSGALNLHGDMTLYLAKDAQLIPSTELKDYPWTSARHDIEDIYDPSSETLGNPAFSSLLNAGTMDIYAGTTTHNIKIMGEGTIGDEDNGLKLREAYDAFCADTTHNKASHYGGGSLISLKNCSDVYLDGVNIRNGMMWTIVPVYCNDITAYDLDINTSVHNGDGFNPNSTSDVYVLSSRFSTGDDCSAIKSGKDAEGREIGIPSKELYYRGCVFTEGHGGITIGSEMSGGVSDVYAEDCKLMPIDKKSKKVNPGIRVKVSPSRGGYINNVNLRDSVCNKISVITNYDKQKAPTPGVTLPDISNFNFENVSAPRGNSDYILDLNGSNFDGDISYLRNLKFTNCSFYKANLNSCQNIEFNKCRLEKGITNKNSIEISENK